jgi:hypothetical protein
VDLSIALQAISTVTLLGALVFGAVQIADLRRGRRDQAAVEIIHSMQLAGFWSVVLSLPKDLTADELIHRGATTVEAAGNMALHFESLGYMVYCRMVPLRIAEDLTGGMVTGCWQRLRPWVEQGRAESGNPALFEWFEWLNDRLLENRQPSKSIGAHRAFKNWKP